MKINSNKEKNHEFCQASTMFNKMRHVVCCNDLSIRLKIRILKCQLQMYFGLFNEFVHYFIFNYKLYRTASALYRHQFYFNLIILGKFLYFPGKFMKVNILLQVLCGLFFVESYSIHLIISLLLPFYRFFSLIFSSFPISVPNVKPSYASDSCFISPVLGQKKRTYQVMCCN